MIRRSRGFCHGCRTRSSRLPSGIVLTYFRQRGHFGSPRPFQVSTRPATQRADAAVMSADTLMLTIPNQVGTQYNLHVLESFAKYVAPELGWKPANASSNP